MENKNLRKNVKNKIISSMLVLALMFFSFLFSDKIEKFLGMNITLAKNEVLEETLSESDYSVNYLDVGQGNCSVVYLPDGKVAVIDGGDEMYGKKIHEFLQERNILKIDFLIATHADSDHIGGLNYLFDKYEIENIFRPFQISGSGASAEMFEVYAYEDLCDVYEHYVTSTNNKSKISRVTSSVYQTFIKNIYSEAYLESEKLKPAKVTVFYDGLKISGENYSFEFFAPLVRDEKMNLQTMSNTKGFATKGYGSTNSNDNSAIFLLTVKNQKFMFSGDSSWKDGSSKESASKTFAENDFLKSLTESERKNLSKVTVFILGHHGSSYSSSQELLNLLSPKFVVVSVGKNNNYGHPSSEVLFRIEKTTNIEGDYLLRTDLNGNVSFGEVSGKIVYSLEKSNILKNQTISWELFAVLLSALIIILIASKKPKVDNKGIFFDMTRK